MSMTLTSSTTTVRMDDDDDSYEEDEHDEFDGFTFEDADGNYEE